jgi:hypothetical protein
VKNLLTLIVSAFASILLRVKIYQQFIHDLSYLSSPDDSPRQHAPRIASKIMCYLPFCRQACRIHAYQFGS